MFRYPSGRPVSWHGSWRLHEMPVAEPALKAYRTAIIKIKLKTGTIVKFHQALQEYFPCVTLFDIQALVDLEDWRKMKNGACAAWGRLFQEF